MRKFLILGGLVLLCGITTSNGKRVSESGVKRSNLSATMDSLETAAMKLETSTERMSNSLNKIR